MYKKVLLSASHEIHTYLNGILGYSSLLEFTELNENQQKQVEKIHRSGENLLALIDDTLLFDTLSNDQTQMNLQLIDVGNLFSTIHESMDAYANSKGKNLIWEQAIPSNFSAHLDESKIHTVVIKILKFFILMDQHKEIRFRVRVEESLILEVLTAEAIIPDEKLGLIFEKISPTDIPNVRSNDCTGFELAIAYKILELLKGKITFKNTEKGSLLTCIYPIVQKLA
ncbi:MAG: HAMP domain-containing sensor histidine kinase [Parachlamydiales bacterium]